MLSTSMKVRYIFLASIIFAILSIVGLRLNAEKALDLKNQILDKDNQAQDAKADLEELRQYVFSHMNTSTKVELVASYNRAVEAAKSGQNNSVYAEAQANCDRRGVSSVAQAQCVQEYLAARVAPTEPSVDKTPYIYSFASPSWSFDLAGVSLLLSIILAIVSLVLYALRLFKSRPEASL